MYNFAVFFSEFTKILVMAGQTNNTANEVEIVDTKDAGFQCQLPDLPETYFAATGGLAYDQNFNRFPK
jgi:hypothetical protein